VEICSVQFNVRKKKDMNIFVGNLPYRASEDEIRELFESFGAVTSVALIKDKISGQPRGFGFVEMANDTEANAAIAALNGKDFQGRALAVNMARPREERGPRPGGGGFGERRGPGGPGGGRRGPGGGQGGQGGQGGGQKRW
jgi:RNA recognition motif-containing protein